MGSDTKKELLPNLWFVRSRPTVKSPVVDEWSLSELKIEQWTWGDHVWGRDYTTFNWTSVWTVQPRMIGLYNVAETRLDKTELQ